ncbi:peptidase domain-containing ABC transporter [Vibrio splendidus]
MNVSKTMNMVSLKPMDLLTFSGLKQVPVVLQSEVAECGLACISMISSYHGHQVNVASLRKNTHFGSQGVSFKDLIDIAGELSLAGRAVKCDIDDIKQLSLPCVLHWDLAHFVVLTKVSNKFIYINDPSLGSRKLTVNQFSDSFTGVALELSPTTKFKKIDERKTLKINQLWDKITGVKRSLIALFLLSILLQITALISPYYMQWVVDNVLLSNDKPLLVVLATGFILLKLIQVMLSSFRAWLVIRFSSAINIQLGANLFQHMIRLPMSYFEKRHIGDVVSRFNSINSIRELFTTGVIETLIDGLMAMVIIIMMYLYNAKLATIVLCFIFTSLIIQIAFYYPNRRITEESIVASAKEDSSFLESIRAVQTIKLFSHEASRQNNWLNKYAEVINTDIRLGKLGITETALTSTLAGFESIFVIYFGALAVMENELTIGMLLAFIAYKGQFTSSILAFIDNIIAFNLLGLHLDRLSDIALEKSEHLESSTELPINTKGTITVDNLSFRYADNSDWILKDISFEIKQGEYVAITGPSGCGKTTLMKLILGLLQPSKGKILIDGVDINQVNLSDYRSRLGSVMQSDSLLSGTLTENITMFDSNFNEERMIKSCQIACILDDIEKLPMGFHSLVGDMGSSFSGGQLQRIYLARAIYKSPVLLCLDESSSHLDDYNELSINKNLTSLGITKIVVAHRQQTIESAERIIRLTNDDLDQSI